MNPGSNGENARSFKPCKSRTTYSRLDGILTRREVCSSALLEIEHVRGTKINGINVSQADLAKGKFSSDLFKEIKIGDELDMQLLKQGI